MIDPLPEDVPFYPRILGIDTGLNLPGITINQKKNGSMLEQTLGDGHSIFIDFSFSIDDNKITIFLT